MWNLTNRNIQILKIIVEEFLETGWVIWSKSLLKKYDLWVSPATVRNDMSYLEDLGLIYQPYNSAWRLPTAKWIRTFVNYFIELTPEHIIPQNSSSNKKDIKTLEDFIHNIVYELSKNTKEISFLIIPEDSIREYSGVSYFIQKNYKNIWDSIFSIIKMIEDKFSFIKFITSLPIEPQVNVFIWEENIIPYLKDYTIIVRPIVIDWKIWYAWIIWTLKMNYSFNISVIKWII